MICTSRQDAQCTVIRLGICLEGFRDGMQVFRVVAVEPERILVAPRPARRWISQGWFAENLLDE